MSGRVGVEQTPDIETLAVRLFLADPDRPGPGPWMSLPEGHQQRYLSMARPLAGIIRDAVWKQWLKDRADLAAAVREARAAELREAADERVNPNDSTTAYRFYSEQRRWLRDRADRIAVDAPEGGEGR